MATPQIPCCEVPVLLVFFSFCKSANPEPCGEFQFCVFVESANPEMPCGAVLSFVEWQLQIHHVIRLQFCWFPDSVFVLPILQVYKFVLWCHLWHHSCNSPTPNMFTVQSSTFVVVSCPDFGRNMNWAWEDKWKMLKCRNGSTKWEEKPPGPLARHSRESVYKALNANRLLSSHFHTSVFIFAFPYFGFHTSAFSTFLGMRLVSHHLKCMNN